MKTLKKKKLILLFLISIFVFSSCKKFGDGVGSLTVPEDNATPQETVSVPTTRVTSPAPVITPVNHNPVLTMPEEIFLLENQASEFSVTYNDEDNDNVTIELVEAPTNLLLDVDSKIITWTPSYNEAGNYNLKLKLNDGKAIVESLVILKVINVNRAPTGSIEADKTYIKSGETVTFTANISDPDMDSLQYLWDFGDGLTSNVQNPTHIFPQINEQATYNVKLSASDGIDTYQSSIDITVDKTYVLAESNVMDVTTEWQQVLFTYKIMNPIIVTGSLTANDPEHASARIRNVTETGFEIKIEEDSSGDGVHATESTSWFAISKGTWTIGSGATIVADQLSTNKLAKFDTSFDSIYHNLNVSPVVIGQLIGDVTHNSANVFAKNRVITCNTVSCTMALDADESISTVDGAGLINWIAIASGQTEPYTDIVSGVTNTALGTINFNTENPAVFVAMQTRNGSDCSNVRFSNLSDTTASVFISEDLASDTENNHIAENVGYLVLAKEMTNLPQSSINDAVAYTLENNTKDINLTANTWSTYLISIKQSGTNGITVIDSPNKILTYTPNEDFVGTDTVILSLMEGITEVDTATITINVLSSGTEYIIGEVGQIDNLSSNWVQVNFADPILDPVVILGPSTTNEKDPASVRIRNLTPTGFEIKIIDSDLSEHIEESISWMAVKKGKWTLENGTIIEAGSVNTNAVVKASNYQTITFDSAYATAPIVLANSNSFNNDMYLNTRINSIAVNNVVLGNDPAENISTNLSVPETIGWVAITPMGSTANNIATQNSLTNAPLPFVFDSLDAYGLLGGMQTRIGGDPCALKIDSITENTINMFLLEDQLADSEQSHGSAEIVKGILLPIGNLYKAM